VLGGLEYSLGLRKVWISMNNNIGIVHGGPFSATCMQMDSHDDVSDMAEKQG